MKNKNNNSELIYFICSTFMYGVGFSSIFKLCKNDSWLVILIGSIISLIILPIYNKLTKDSKLIKSINITFILLINLMILRILTTSFYLTKTPGLLITIPFILLCLYNSKKGISTISKESNILFIFSIITIVLNLLASTKTGSITFFLPLMHTKKINIIKGIIYYIVYIISPLVLVNNNSNYKSDIKFFLIINILILFMSIIIIFVLGPNLITMLRFPEYMIYKEINLFGFIENVENLVGLVYYINLFITSSLCLYTLKSIVKHNYIIYLIIVSILVITEFVSDKYKYSLLIYKYLPQILITLVILYIFNYILKKE